MFAASPRGVTAVNVAPLGCDLSRHQHAVEREKQEVALTVTAVNVAPLGCDLSRHKHTGEREKQEVALSVTAVATATRIVSALRPVAGPFILTRVVLAIVGMVTVALVPRFEGTGNVWLTSQPWLNIWSIWDSRWYLSIARDGYSYAGNQESNAAFAPGLPLLMHAICAAIGRSDDEAYLMAGFLITNAALLVALAYLVRLVRLDFDHSTAARAALYLLVFPSSFFLSAVYPHSLFLALSIASFYYARQGRWWLAGVLGCLTGLTRLQGCALVIPIAYEYLRQHGFRWTRLRRDVLSLSLIPVGLLAFAAYLFAVTGEPLAALKAGAAWDRRLTWPWDVLGPFLANPLADHASGTATDFLVIVLLLVVVGLSWRRIPSSLALFTTVFTLVIVSSGILFSSVRYVLELFPIFITLARLGERPLFHRAYLGLACLNGLRLMSLFALGAWIA